MEVRQLRYVVLLAECLHFGRAAERAYISQPSFSQQIARLEAELGTRLFDRSSNRVALTTSGEVLLAHAKGLLADFEAAAREVREVGGHAAGSLRVGLFADSAGELTPQILSTYRRSCPDVRLTFVELTMSTQFQSLSDESVDVALLRPPLPSAGLDFDLLFAEPRMAILPVAHPLGSAPSISVDDLAPEPFVTAKDRTPEAWRAFWSCDADRGEPARVVAEMDSIAEGLNAVAYLGAVDTCPAATARHYPHPGVVYIRLEDGGYAQAAVARRHGDKRPQVQAFAAVAGEVARRYLHAVPDAVSLDDMPSRPLATSSG